VARAVREVTEGRGADAAILTGGGQRALVEAVDLVRDGGILVLFASDPGRPMVDLDIHRFFHRELSLVSSYSPSTIELQEALALLADGTIRVKALVTHRVPLADLGHGMRLFRDKEALKVFVETEEP
jgi:L-iditol 2-dehydrogenase